MEFQASEDFAAYLDSKDQLKSYRDQFYIPEINNKPCIYFTGNSLGLQPKTLEKYLNHELEVWKKLGVEGHFKAEKRPWFHYHKFSKEILAHIVGAKPIEVVAMNNLTSNLHFMMVSFYQPKGKRFKIVMEKDAFPSDQYAIESQVRFHGYDPKDAIIEIAPRQGEYTLRTEDIIKQIEDEGDAIALVLFSGVQYYTGQYFDLKTITQAAHKVGAYAGFDLAHAAGNVTLKLNQWQVDFAVWCSYKYLNSGPGGIAGIFVHEKHANNDTLPRFAGWWGYNEEKRFKMQGGFEPMPGADGWQLSNVNVLSTAAHMASLEIFDDVGMPALQAKSEKMTAYTLKLLKEVNKAKGKEWIKIITPIDPEARGCQLSLVCTENGKKLFDYLTDRNVILDWREPDVLRMAPVPLYNSYKDIYEFYKILMEFSPN